MSTTSTTTTTLTLKMATAMNMVTTVLAYENGTLDRFDVSLGAKCLFVCLFLPNKMQSYYEKIH